MAEVTLPDGWIDPQIDFDGIDGNAFFVMAHVRRGLRRAGNTPDVIDAYTSAAKSGDYDHLLRVSMLYAGLL